jgi:hypothetical protein
MEQLRDCIVDAAIAFAIEIAEPPTDEPDHLGTLDRTTASVELARLSGEWLPVLLAAANEIDPERHPVAAELLATAILRTGFAGD